MLFTKSGVPHQKHDTGPTNNPIPHDVPINKWTTIKGIGMRRKVILGAAMLPLPPSLPECINTQTVSHSTTTTTWTVPPGVTGVLVKAQGEGGNGANAPNCGNGNIGGGGGGYAVSLLPVLPGETYTITVGSGGTGTDTLFSGPGGTVIGYAGYNYGPGGLALGQFTTNGGDSFVPPPYNGAAGGFAGSGALGGAGGTGGFAGCDFAETVSVTITDANNFPGCSPLGPKTLTWVPDEEMENGGSYLGDGSYFPCEQGFTSYSGGSCCGGWGQVCVGPLENATCYSLPDSGNTCGSITLYGSAVHDTYAVVTGLSGSCAAGNPGLPGTLGSGGGGGGGGSPGGTGGVGGAGFIEISWGNPFGLNGLTHQTHTTTQTNFTISNCTPLNQYTTTKGIGMRRKAILGAAMLPPPFPPHLELSCTRLITSTSFEGDTSTTWTVPFGVYQILVECQADGANGDNGSGGSDGNGGYGGNGGTGGGYASSIINVIPGVTYTLTSNIGVTTEFGPSPLVQASSGGLGGGASGDLVIPGTPGWSGGPGDTIPLSYSGNGGYGGAGGVSGYASAGGSGGAGSITFPGPPATNGTDGSDFGGGGGGGGGGSGSMEPAGTGGDGGAAFIRISWHSFFGFEGDIHQIHTTTQTNFSLLHCQPLNQWTTTKGIGMRRKWILAAAMLPLPPSLPECINIQTLSHVSTTTTTWTVPPGVTGVLVKAQGEGGNGGNAVSCGNGTIGGGGGGYAVSLLPVLPGQTYTVTVGSGGTGTDTLFSGPGGTVIGYAGVNYGPGGLALGQYTANGGNSFVPPPYNGAAGGFAGSGAFGGAGGIGFPGCSFGATVTVVFNDAGDLFGCGGPFTKTLTWNGSYFVGDGDYGICPKDATSWDGAGCCSGWGTVTIEFEAPIFYSIPDGGNTCGNIILYGAGGASATITGGAGSCTPGNPGLPGTLGSGGGGGGGGDPGGTGGQGGAGFIEISWGNPFGLNGFAHQTHTTTQTNFVLLHCTPLNQYTTTKGIGMRRKWILGSAMLPPPEIIPLPIYINKRSCNCQFD